MDLGLANGIYNNKLEGNANGLYDNILAGLHNGMYNENMLKDNIVKNGLILYYDIHIPKSYPITGNILYNIVNYNNNGVLTNSPTYTNEKNGGLSFDGVDDFVDNTFINPYSETIIVWARSNVANWNVNGWISSSRRQNGHIIHPNGGGKTVRFFIANSSATLTEITPSIVPSDVTVPHFYAITTNGINSHKSYFDGNIVAENTTSITRTLSPTSQIWYLGRDDNSTRYGNGVIYSAFRYSRELSASEIYQNYIVTKSRFGY